MYTHTNSEVTKYPSASFAQVAHLTLHASSETPRLAGLLSQWLHDNHWAHCVSLEVTTTPTGPLRIELSPRAYQSNPGLTLLHPQNDPPTFSFLRQWLEEVSYSF